MPRQNSKTRLDRLNRFIDNIEKKLEKKPEEEKIEVFSFKCNFTMLPCDIIDMIISSHMTEMESRVYLSMYSMAYGYKPFNSNEPTGRTEFITRSFICRHTGILLQNIKNVMDKLLDRGCIEIAERLTLKSGQSSDRYISYWVKLPIYEEVYKWVYPEECWYMEKSEKSLQQKIPVMRITKSRADPLSEDMQEMFGKDIYELLDDVNKITFSKSILLNGEQIREILESICGSSDNLRNYAKVRGIKSYDKLLSLVVDKALSLT